MASVLDIAGAIGNLLDDVFTSDEERKAFDVQLKQLDNQLNAEYLAQEAKILEAKSAVIQAEAQGESWLQRNWRPITMLTFLVLITLDCFGVLQYRLSEQAWTLLQLGLGGYVIGRSVEKAIPRAGQLISQLKRNKNG